MIDYDRQDLGYLKDKMASIMTTIERDGFLAGRGTANNYPSYVFEYDPVFEPYVSASVKELPGFIRNKMPDTQVTVVHLFDFAREYLKQNGKWEKSLELEISKGNDFLFLNLTKTLLGSKIADYFLETVLLQSPGLILIHGVGMAYPILRGHEVLKNLPQRIGKHIPIILFYPGTYDGKYLKPFGCITEQNEYQALRWPF